MKFIYESKTYHEILQEFNTLKLLLNQKNKHLEEIESTIKVLEEKYRININLELEDLKLINIEFIDYFVILLCYEDMETPSIKSNHIVNITTKERVEYLFHLEN